MVSRYYIERIGQAIVTFVTAVTLSFVMYRLMPGGPLQAMQSKLATQMVREGFSPAEVQERVDRLAGIYTGIDPNAPILQAYADYLGGIIFHLDFGRSLQYQEPVFDIMFRAMPWSIFISVNGLLLGVSTAVLLGAVMAYFEGSKTDSGLTLFILVMSAIPYYVGALAMLSLLAYAWGIFPTGGRWGADVTQGFNIPFIISVAYHATLPTLSGFIIGFGGGALGMRGNSIRIIGSEYLRSARLRGIGTNRITTRYIARNAILPIYTGLMIGIAGIFSSSVIMERIFLYQGVGWYLFSALTSQDYPLLMGAFLFFTLLTVIGILLADLTYGIIDPRAGTGADRESY